MAGLWLVALLCSSCQTAQKDPSFRPNVLFRESDIQKITGLNLSALKAAVATFLDTVKTQQHIPAPDSLAGEWLFGVSPRYQHDNRYLSVEQLKEAWPRIDPETEKYFYRDVQSVWDFEKLQLGRWSFILEGDQIHGSIWVSSQQKDRPPRHRSFC